MLADNCILSYFISSMNNIKQTLLGLAMILGFVGVFLVSAIPVSAATCGGTETNIIGCDQVKRADNDPTPVSIKDNAIWGVLMLAINILTGGIGIAAIGGIVYGSVLWSSSGSSLEGVKKAKEIITNVVIGLVAWAAMYSLLNFFIPGGLFA